MVLMTNLPQRQMEILHFIVRTIDDKKQSPTIKEIAEALDLKIPNVHSALDALEKKGKIKREKFCQRSIAVMEG